MEGELQDSFIAVALDEGVDFDMAQSIWAATDGDFDAAMGLLRNAGSKQAESVQEQDEDAVRAPIKPTGPVRLIDADPDPRGAHGGNYHQHENRRFGHRQHAPAPPLPQANPFEVVPGRFDPQSKNARLAELFRPPEDITFQGDFDAAVRLAESRGLQLLVNVQDASDFQCQMLNRDTWSNKRLKKFVSENFVFWQPLSVSPSGQYFTRFYPVDLFPHIAVIDPVTRARTLGLSGFVEPDQLLKRLKECTLPSLSSSSSASFKSDSPAEPLNRSMSTAEQEALERAISESLQDVVHEAETAPKKRKTEEEKHEDEDEKELEGEHEVFAEEEEEEEANVESIVEEIVPVGVSLPADSSVRVRDATGRSVTLSLHGSDSVARLLYLVASEFGRPRWKKIRLSTMMPKVSLELLPLDSTVKENGLKGLSLVLGQEETL